MCHPAFNRFDYIPLQTKLKKEVSRREDAEAESRRLKDKLNSIQEMNKSTVEQHAKLSHEHQNLKAQVTNIIDY